MKKVVRKRIEFPVGVLLCFICTYGFSVFIPFDRSILWICFFSLTATVVYSSFSVKTSAKVDICAVVIGILFSAFTTVGYELEREGALAIYKEFVLQFIGLAVLFSLALKLLFTYLVSYEPQNTFPIKNRGIETLITGLLILICWLPYFVVFYPGTMSSDALGEIRQQLGMSPLSNHHPIMHQLFIKLCLLVSNNSVETATVVYSVIQMLFLASVFASGMTYIRRKGASLITVIIAGLCFAFFPANPLYAIMMEKGSSFAGITLWLMILLLKETESQKQGERITRFILLTIVSFLFCTIRNNGFYAFIIGFLCFILANREKWKRLLCVYVLILTLVIGYQHVIYDILGVAKPSSGESLSIPLQQIARVVHDDPGVTGTQVFGTLGELFFEPDIIGEIYEPTVSDPVKQTSVFKSDELDRNPKQYAIDWLRLGLSYPKQYIEAFLMQNYGYWFTDNSHYTVSYSIFSPNDFELQNNTKFEALREQMTDAISKMQYSSLFSILFSIGFSCWILLITAVALCLRKDKRIASPLLIIAGLWLTTIAGPMYCEYRYLYALVVCIPVFSPLVFRKKNE